MKNRKLTQQSWFVGFVAFLLVFVFQVFFNRYVLAMRSLPDELGAVALGAKWAGYDWNYVLSNPSMYYGSATAPLVCPLFQWIKNPVVLYQALLAVGACLRSIPAILAVKISMDFYEVKAGYAVAFGIACVLFAPTRAVNIDNEPMLLLMCWCIVYMLVLLHHTNTKRQQIIYTILTVCFLGYSLMSHTRAVAYIILFVGILVIYYIFERRVLIHVPTFAVLLAGFYLISQRVIRWSTELLFTAPIGEEEANTVNTIEALRSSISGGLQQLMGEYGIRGFLDLVLGNFWIVSVFGCGIIGVMLFQTIREGFKHLRATIRKQEDVKPDGLFYVAAFCLAGFVATLLALSVTWLDAALGVHYRTNSISRGHFYLRYYGNYFGPILLCQLISWYRGAKGKRLVTWAALIAMGTSAVYSIRSFVVPSLRNGYTGNDWFGYFAPFSFQVNDYQESGNDLLYFVLPSLVALVLFGIIYCCKKRTVVLVLLISILAYRYGYSVLYWDMPYANGERYYQAGNAIGEAYYTHPECFEGVESIYYVSDYVGAQYNVQFALRDISVISKMPEAETEEMLLLYSHMPEDMQMPDWKYILLDENEILFIKGTELWKRFEVAGFEVF